MKWVKPIHKLPELSGIGMSNYVAVKVNKVRYRYGKDEIITISGRYCHDRKCWFLPAFNENDVIEWLDESQ